LLWILDVLFWLMFLFLRVVNAIPGLARPPEHAANYTPEGAASFTHLFWVGLALMTATAAIAHLALRHFWHRPARSPGFGFWLISVVLYLAVMFISASGFPPYFAVGDRSSLQWVSLAIGAFFLVLCFPRLPSAPPPLPQSKANMRNA
jgi:hypothetical protein